MKIMSFLRCDPRVYQITALSGLLLFGVCRLDFEISAAQVAVTLLTVLGVQMLATRLTGAGRFEWKSALISGLSLCLLLRTSSLWLAAAGAGAAIGSKFVLRWQGKHVFNPTNFALVLLLLCADGCAWVSPGQWGSVDVLRLSLRVSGRAGGQPGRDGRTWPCRSWRFTWGCCSRVRPTWASRWPSRCTGPRAARCCSLPSS